MLRRVEQEKRMSNEDIRQMMLCYPDRSYLVFPEDRTWPIHYTDRLPDRWKDREQGTSFHGSARPGEWYTWQIGIYAARVPLRRLKLECGELAEESGQRIDASAVRCFNLGGVDTFGHAFEKEVNVAVGDVQTLWIGIQIPQDAAAGKYEGSVRIQPQGLNAHDVRYCLDIGGEVLTDGGVSEPWRHSRLYWLDSSVALDDEPTAPYGPLERNGRTMTSLGRSITFGDAGLPESIKSYYTPFNDRITEEAREILDAPVRFIIERETGPAEFDEIEAGMAEENAGKACWTSTWRSQDLSVDCKAWTEYDGFTGYRITVRADRRVPVKDIRLDITYRTDAAQYAMGLGHKGGFRPEAIDWKWDVTLNQDTLWMGDINAGLMVRLLDPEYEKPHMLFYYVQKPLRIPQAWSNEGKGGVVMNEDGPDHVLLRAYSGERVLQPGEELHFDFDLMPTLVKPIDKEEHWNDLYLHKVPESMDELKESGANVINVHHANDIAPFINYPFIEHEALAEFVQECHEHRVKAKLYYTVKELTYRMTELWAFRSLGDEIVADGGGIGFHGPHKEADAWLEQHFGDHYIPAWKSTMDNNKKYKGSMEASVVVNPMSRYNNYFLEDIRWMLQKTDIDGLYFDDVAFDRTVMRRVRKLLDRHREGGRIDLHSWNYFKNNNIDDSRLAGWGNSVNLYIDNFPYVDRMWFGEGFDYDETPDFWLIEMSGIPFGMMGEMLQNGGNLWRGMVYGMTSRMPFVDVRGIWQFWNDFGILEADLIGYWNEDCPVRTDREDILTTVYKKPGQVLIAAASWADGAAECRLQIDWAKLGMDAKKTETRVPSIAHVQESRPLDLSRSIPFDAGKGWLIHLVER